MTIPSQRKIHVLWKILFVIISTLVFFLPLSFVPTGSPILLTANDYDSNVARISNQNFLKDGFFKNWAVPNRKGAGRVSFYDGADGCWIPKIEFPGPEMTDIRGASIPFDSLTNDCLYTHHPPLGSYYWYALAKIGIIDPARMDHYVFYIFPFYLGLLIVLFLLLSEMGIPPGASLIATFFVISSRVSIMTQYDLLFRPFEYFFFILLLYSYFKRQSKGLVLSLVFCLLSGYDLAIGAVAISTFYFWSTSSSFQLKKYTGLVVSLVAIASIAAQRFFLMGYDMFFQDLSKTFYDRSVGTVGYWPSLCDYLKAYYLIISSQLVDIRILFWCLICLTYSHFRHHFTHQDRRILRFSIFILISTLSLGFIFPLTQYTHAWVKTSSGKMWALVLLALCFSMIFKLLTSHGTYGRKNINFDRFVGIGLALTFTLLLQPWFLQIKNQLQQLVKMSSVATKPNLEKLEDFWLSNPTSPNWAIQDLRKVLLVPDDPRPELYLPYTLPTPQYKQILSRSIEFNFKFFRPPSISKILIKAVNPNGDFQCTAQSLEDGAWKISDGDGQLVKSQYEFKFKAEQNSQLIRMLCKFTTAELLNVSLD